MRIDVDAKVGPCERLAVRFATTAQEVRDAQRLRWRVFAEEQGARLSTAEPGYDIDDLDAHCEHLIVVDQNEVIGTYRLLTAEAARRAGGYYSQREFDLHGIVSPDRRLLEIGRSCVLAPYRTGATIAKLWSGLAGFLLSSRHDALIGCASIPLGADVSAGARLAYMLAETYAGADDLRATPRQPLPRPSDAGGASVAIPPLVKGYFRSGARVCGQPYWDPDFNCADLFLYLGRDQLTARYARHFIDARRSSVNGDRPVVDAAA